MLESMSSNTLEYQRLSKEEMQRRGILGRLVGPCADVISPTRNGRKYPEKLWENVFNDPIMKERIENGVCYGELGHPLDREETDMEKVAICLAEVPKKGKDGKLRSVFDILDTPCGRILKSLCDYGSTIGISSRGSGDLEEDWDGNESVNPDTYTCEGFDAVLIPAVKEARLQYVTESLNKTRYNKTLREKLVESIDKEDESNQQAVKESLNILGIDLEEGRQYKDHDLTDTDKGTVIRDSKGNYETTVPTDDEATEYVDDKEDQSYNRKYEIKYVDRNDRVSTATVPAIDKTDAEKKAKSQLGNNCYKIVTVTELNEDINQETGDIDNEANSKEVVNDESLVEELQKALRLNKVLDDKIVTLQEKLSVGYAKEVKLNEQIEGYKARILKLSKSTNEVKALNEKLNTVSKTNETIDTKCKKLTESVYKRNETITQLRESISKKDEDISNLQTKLDESVKQLKEQKRSMDEVTDKYDTLNKDMSQLKESYSKKVEKQNQLIEKYRNIAMRSVDKYIDTQANMLGVRSAEIKNRLPESYSFKDIDRICEDLREYKLNMSSLPFSTHPDKLSEGMRVTAKNVSNKTLVPVEEDVDELTLRMAGLI